MGVTYLVFVGVREPLGVGREAHRIGRRGHVAGAGADVGDGFQCSCLINGDGSTV